MLMIDKDSDDKSWDDYIESVRRWMDITIKDYQDDNQE
jgi:hypothetical protein